MPGRPAVSNKGSFGRALVVAGSESYTGAASLSCLGDIDGNSVVDNSDLEAGINLWGPCTDCPEDRTPCGGDGVVNVIDLLAVINQWGPCP